MRSHEARTRSSWTAAPWSRAFARGLLGAMLLGVSPAARAQVADLSPADEATRDASFFVFRARLTEALARRDTVALYAALAPNILNSFGGDGGPAEFKKIWRPGESGSALWGVLGRILALGGAFRDDTLFLAPYVYSHFPPELDPLEHTVIVGSDVRVRSRPSAEAHVVGLLSFVVVRTPLGSGPVADERPEAEGRWIEVILANSARGYVAEDFSHRPLGYRAVFARRGGRWVLTALVAGD